MLQLAAHVSSAAALESACGPWPTLLAFDDPAAPADCGSPNAGEPVWQVPLPVGWQHAAERGVLCAFCPADDWRGHFRVCDAAGTCCAQGLAAVGAAANAEMRLQILPLNTLLTIAFA